MLPPLLLMLIQCSRGASAFGQTKNTKQSLACRRLAFELAQPLIVAMQEAAGVKNSSAAAADLVEDMEAEEQQQPTQAKRKRKPTPAHPSQPTPPVTSTTGVMPTARTQKTDAAAPDAHTHTDAVGNSTLPQEASLDDVAQTQAQPGAKVGLPMPGWLAGKQTAAAGAGSFVQFSGVFLMLLDMLCYNSLTMASSAALQQEDSPAQRSHQALINRMSCFLKFDKPSRNSLKSSAVCQERGYRLHLSQNGAVVTAKTAQREQPLHIELIDSRSSHSPLMPTMLHELKKLGQATNCLSFFLLAQ